jgi:hypothetical protein
MFLWLRHLIGWIVSALGSRRDLILENLALRQQLLSLHGKRPRPRLSATHKLFWVLLRGLWSGWKTPLLLVTPRTVVEWHRGWLSSVLEMALQSQPGRWPKARGQGDSGSDLSYGCRKPDVGSTPYSRRAAEAGLQCVGANGFTLAATSAEESGCGQALADLFTEPSRGHCRDGLFQRPDPHLWCSLLLLCNRP